MHPFVSPRCHAVVREVLKKRGGDCTPTTASRHALLAVEDYYQAVRVSRPLAKERTTQDSGDY